MASYNLVGDIGGTNARFAIVSQGSSELISIKTLQCEKFETLSHYWPVIECINLPRYSN